MKAFTFQAPPNFCLWLAPHADWPTWSRATG